MSIGAPAVPHRSYAHPTLWPRVSNSLASKKVMFHPVDGRACQSWRMRVGTMMILEPKSKVPYYEVCYSILWYLELNCKEKKTNHVSFFVMFHRSIWCANSSTKTLEADLASFLGFKDLRSTGFSTISNRTKTWKKGQGSSSSKRRKAFKISSLDVKSVRCAKQKRRNHWKHISVYTGYNIAV